MFSVSPLPAIPLFKNMQKWLLWPKAGGSVENGYVLSWESCAAIPAMLRWKGKVLRSALFARKRLQRTVVSSERRTVPSCLTDKKVFMTRFFFCCCYRIPKRSKGHSYITEGPPTTKKKKTLAFKLKHIIHSYIVYIGFSYLLTMNFQWLFHNF